MSRAPTIRRPHPGAHAPEPAPRPWAGDPRALLAVAIGIGYLALGATALARTGLSLGHLDHPHTEVVGFGHSPVLGLAEIVAGALLVVDGMVPGGRRTMAVVGALLSGLGLVLVVDLASASTHRWLGAADPYGWLSLIVGVFLLVTAGFLPDVVADDARTHHRHVVT